MPGSEHEDYDEDPSPPTPRTTQASHVDTATPVSEYGAFERALIAVSETGSLGRFLELL